MWEKKSWIKYAVLKFILNRAQNECWAQFRCSLIILIHWKINCLDESIAQKKIISCESISWKPDGEFRFRFPNWYIQTHLCLRVFLWIFCGWSSPESSMRVVIEYWFLFWFLVCLYVRVKLFIIIVIIIIVIVMVIVIKNFSCLKLTWIIVNALRLVNTN